MPELYVKGQDGVLMPATSVRCKNEEKELQNLLHLNPTLLAGEQINPDEPRRWLLIKREMSVPDPTTGSGRWAIDFLYIDQDATLTFVECKRHGDTRSRREVIAQIIDYVANSARLWKAKYLVEAARSQAISDQTTLEAEVKRLGASDFANAETLMEAAVQKLNGHDVRVILFMEAAPPELKTIVEFMNEEMKSVEVLLVEARMYEFAGHLAISPILWGYTEKVRERKLAMAVAAGDRQSWDEPKFFADLRGRITNELQLAAVQRMYSELPDAGYFFRFGTGSATGSINARLPAIADSALATIRSDGTLTVQFGSFAAPEKSWVSQALAHSVRGAGLSVPADYEKRYINYRIADWTPHVDKLIDEFSKIARLNK